MSFLTIFTAPKPFVDPHIATIQRNAIASWMQLGADVEVLLLGDEEGMAEAAAELGARHISNVECNQSGVPLISSMFAAAHRAGESPLLAYLNTDILALPDLVETARSVSAQAQKFLLVGQRWDLDVEAPLDFGDGWANRLREKAAANGRLHPPAGSDYFIFPRGLFSKVPDLVVGRAGWDNWMIYHATTQPWPSIDATEGITVIHQNHDYAHLPGGKAHYKLSATFENVELAGGYHRMYTLREVNRALKNGRIRPVRFSLVRMLHRLKLLVIPRLDHNPSGLRWWLTLSIKKMIKRLEV